MWKKGNVSTSNNSITLTVQNDTGVEQFGFIYNLLLFLWGQCVVRLRSVYNPNERTFGTAVVCCMYTVAGIAGMYFTAIQSWKDVAYLQNKIRRI